MSVNTVPQLMTRKDAAKIDLLNEILKALREGKGEHDDFDIAGIIRASREGNETSNKVWWLVGCFAVCAVVGSYLAVKVISQGEAISGLQVEIQKCEHKP